MISKLNLYEKYRKQTAAAFNYPSVKLVSSGDICKYIETLNEKLLRKFKKEAGKIGNYRTIKQVTDDDVCAYLLTIKYVNV